MLLRVPKALRVTGTPESFGVGPALAVGRRLSSSSWRRAGEPDPRASTRKGAHVARMQRAAPGSWGDPEPVPWRRPGKLSLPAPQSHQCPGASPSFTPALWRLKLGVLVSENRHQPRVCPAEQCHTVGRWVQTERAGRQAPGLGAGAAVEPCQEGRLGWGLPLPDSPSFGSWSSDSLSLLWSF